MEGFNYINGIFILTNNYDGLKSFRIEVVQAILESGFKVIISAPYSEQAEIFRKMGCTIIDTPFDRRGTNPVSDIRLLCYYIKLFRKVHPRVALTYTIKPNIYGGIACRLCRVPQFANITGLGDAVEAPSILQKVTIFLYRVGLKKTHTIFYQNDGNRNFCRSNGIGNYARAILLPGSGVNLNWHKLQDYPQESPVIFMFIGRLLKQKGVDEFLESAEYVKKRYKNNVEFHILGPIEDDYSDKVRCLTDSGVIIYHSATNDVRPFLSHIHCLVHPSYHEGLSNVCLEASANGRPIITTNVDGCRETIEDGVTGFLVASKDVQDLSNKISNFYLLPWEKKREMGLAARKRMINCFDRNIVVKSYIDEIMRLIAHSTIN